MANEPPPDSSGKAPVALIWKPSKSSFRMKLTTPVTASAPYTADAPPVVTSTRSTKALGMVPISTAEVPRKPATCRRPFTRVSVLSEPNPRRFKELEPVSVFSAVEEEISAGISLTISARFNSPDMAISLLSTDCTGTEDSTLGSVGIREPVMLITSTDFNSSSVSWARVFAE